MAITALNTAATGLRALSTRIDVVANNLANAETNAFKRQRTNFEDLMYLALKQPGMRNAADQLSPAGIYVGLGVKISNTQLDMEQGSLENTGRDLDIGISGRGFFQIKIDPNRGNGLGYTRNGNLFLNNNGDLVVGMGDGYLVDPPINIPPNATDLSVSQDGIVQYLPAGSQTKTTAGQLKLYDFINPQGLNLLGGSIYTETEASGQPTENNPGQNGTGKVLQGFLEASNVDPVKELVGLIKTQRSFELNSQSIQSADQALQTIGNLRRN